MEQTITGGNTTNSLTLNATKEINDDFKKRVEKYLKLSHQTLAEMLALRDEDEGNTKVNQPYIPNQPYVPYQPYTPYFKWCPVGTGGQCTNPFGDCINCPYHGGVTYDTKFYTTSCTSNLGGDADSTKKKDNDRLSFVEWLKESNLD